MLPFCVCAALLCSGAAAAAAAAATPSASYSPLVDGVPVSGWVARGAVARYALQLPLAAPGLLPATAVVVVPRRLTTSPSAPSGGASGRGRVGS